MSLSLIKPEFNLDRGILSSDKRYQLEIVGLTEFEEAPPGPKIVSNEFSGLKEAFAEFITAEFKKDGISFSANTNKIRAKLTVVIAPKGEDVPDFSHSAVKENPVFDLDYPTIARELGKKEIDLGAGLPLGVALSAEDGSGRSQTVSINLKVDAGDLQTKDTGDQKKLSEFKDEIAKDKTSGGTDSGSPNTRKAITVGNVLKTGLAAIIQFMLPALSL